MPRSKQGGEGSTPKADQENRTKRRMKFVTELISKYYKTLFSGYG